MAWLLQVFEADESCYEARSEYGLDPQLQSNRSKKKPYATLKPPAGS